MVTYDRLGFHNVAELAPAPGGGLHLARFPCSVWPSVESGHGPVRHSNGCEIRFVSTARRVRLYLRSLHEGHVDTQHLRGSQLVRRESRVAEGGIRCVDIDLAPLEPNRTAACRAPGGFDPRVYRLYCSEMPLAYHGVDAAGGDLRPPTPDELPRRRWLAYGSSITQGSSFENYVNAAATMLEADVCNLGMAGSCRIEKPIVDFIAARDDWDFATFELGINLRQVSGDNTGFALRTEYLLDQVTARHAGKPLFLITIFDNGIFHEAEPSGWQRDLREKNAILRDLAGRYPQVTLIDGEKLIPDFRGFRVDLLHPEALAAYRMGLALADLIRPVIESQA